MRSRSIVAALLVLLGASSASAQVLSLEFHDGRVRLIAENVPVSRILSEWARLGGTKIVNGERVPGAPVTLQIVDVPERQALETVLRGAAGYMVLARDAATPSGASSFDKILVLPTTSRAPAAAAIPSPPPPQFQNRLEPEPEPEPDVEIDDSQGSPEAPPRGAFPRGRLPGVNAPAPSEGPDDDEPGQETPPPPSPGNPFGVVPGGARPGTVNTPPARNPNEAEPVPR
ncbi:MAG TPA: hypothetical protein VMS40_20800 [Vicinamibacterales bacterium]|nr:hypothetical protein [Vicinamibacterales bacterium]